MFCDNCYNDLCPDNNPDEPFCFDCDGITVEIDGQRYDVCDQQCGEELRDKIASQREAKTNARL